jgi:4-alpha-glucanotransferase
MNNDDMSKDVLFRLAHAAGIATEWVDAFGMPQTVNASTVQAILRALHLPCDSDAECEAGMIRLAEEEIELAVPPLITAQVGQEIVFSPHARLHGLAYRVELENGGEIIAHASADSTMPARIAAINQIGYHTLRIATHQITLAVAPLRCFSVADAVAGASGMPADVDADACVDACADACSDACSDARQNRQDHPTPRLWALAAQLYSLRRDDDHGVGDFRALDTLTRAAAAHGAAAIAISPVHAMFSANPYHYSPYAPSSRLFFNAMHIAPAAVSGTAVLEEVIAGLGLEQERQRLRTCELIDWPAVARWQLAVLRALYDRYDQRSAGWQEFIRFRTEGGLMLDDHARFEALHAAMRTKGIEGDWRSWPAPYRHPRSAEVAAFAAEHTNEVCFHAFLQWQAARGLQHAQQSARAAGMAIGLISDLAVGAEGGGSQAWSRQNEMLEGLSVGAPPDLLGPLGQNWGLAAFSPRALKQHGYQAYIEMLRAAFRYAGGVRIDHILGLTRMWLVPNQASGKDGAYLRYPFEDLLRLIALESHRYRAIVIGEDLGTVPPGFSDTLADAGLMGIRVLWFERDGNGFKDAQQWSDRAIATTSTHDLPTVLGWWRGSDISWRDKLELMAPGTDAQQAFAERADERRALTEALQRQRANEYQDTHLEEQLQADSERAPLTEILQFVGATPAPLAIIPLEDALAQIEQPNLPNTIDTHPNWRRRLPENTGQMLDQAAVSARLAVLQKARMQLRAKEQKNNLTEENG